MLGVETPWRLHQADDGPYARRRGRVQAALCLLAMRRGRMPPHLWDGVRDPALAPIRLAAPGEHGALKHILSASYAFGGNNAALLLAAS